MIHFTRGRRRLLVAALAAAAVLVLLMFREPILVGLGRLLVVDDPPAPADVIVVAIDAREAGVLEAADLFHRGIAPRVAVFADPPTAADLEFLKRGLPYFDLAAHNIEQLRALGVTEVERVPRAVAGTGEEAQLLPGWLEQERYRSVVLVTTADHARRVARAVRRAMKDRPETVLVRSSPFSEFRPQDWWRSRSTLRIGIVELEKLLLDFVAHPFG